MTSTLSLSISTAPDGRGFLFVCFACPLSNEFPFFFWSFISFFKLYNNYACLWHPMWCFGMQWSYQGDSHIYLLDHPFLWVLLILGDFQSRIVRMIQAPVLVSWAQGFFSGVDAALNELQPVDRDPGFSQSPFPEPALTSCLGILAHVSSRPEQLATSACLQLCSQWPTTETWFVSRSQWCWSCFAPCSGFAFFQIFYKYLICPWRGSFGAELAGPSWH